ncbi:hypothetical protein SCANM63S_09873 [Streptomyces canarius]
MRDRSAGAWRPQWWMALSWARNDESEMASSRSSVRSFSRARKAWAARRSSAVPVKKRYRLGSLRVRTALMVSLTVRLVTLSMPGPPAGPVPARMSLRTRSGSSAAMTWVMKPAHQQAEQVDPVVPEGPDEQHGVAGHRLDRVRCGAAGRAGAALVEGDHRAPGGESVDDAGIPVVQDCGQVVEEDQWYAVVRAELPVDEDHATHGNGAVRGVLVRRRGGGAGRRAHGRVLRWCGGERGVQGLVVVGGDGRLRLVTALTSLRRRHCRPLPAPFPRTPWPGGFARTGRRGR